MIDRNGQVSGPGVLDGLWREGAEFGPLAFQRALVNLGLALPWLAAMLSMATEPPQSWAALGATASVLAMLVLPGLVLISAQAAPASALACGEWRAVGRAWHEGLVVALLLGLVAVAVGALGAMLLPWLGQPPALVQAMAPGLFTLSLAVMALLAASCTAATLLCAGRTGSVVAVVGLVNLVSLLLLSWPPADLFGAHGDGLRGVALVAVLMSWLAAALLAALTWWQPQQRRYGIRQAFGGLRLQANRRSGPSAVSSLCVALSWSVLVLLAGGLDEVALAALTALSALLLPGLAVGQALAASMGRRVTLVLAGAMKKPGSVGRCGQRCAWLSVLIMLGLVGLTSQAVMLTRSTGRLQAELSDLLLLCLPLALAMVVAQAACSLWAQGLRSLDRHLQVNLVLAVSALLSVPLAWVLAFPLGAGLKGILAAPALCTAVAALLLARWFRHAAGTLDARAADQMRARARAIALGWADTVMVWPGHDAAARPAGMTAARRAALR